MTLDEALATITDADQRQEMKEGVADAHLEFVRRRTSGEGDMGRILFGCPSRTLASGFLLPRVNADGDDEANDIRVNTHGLDIAIHREAEGVIQLRVSLSVYLRILPTSAELFDDEGRLIPPADYSQECKTEMRTMRKALRDQRITATTPREDRQAIIDAIAREIEAHYGVDAPLNAPGPALGSDDDDDGDTNPEPVVTKVAQRRRIPARYSRAYEVPKAFIRIDVPAIDVELLIPPGDHWGVVAADATQRLLIEIRTVCAAWIASPEGIERAWRSAPRPVSEDFWTPEAWDSYLIRVRQGPPIEAELIPSFQLSFHFDALEIRREPVGHSVRLSLENEREVDDEREYGVFLVSMEVSLPEAALVPASLERVKRSYHLEGFLELPAIGLNCGVENRGVSAGRRQLRTTWMPRYVLPRTTQHGIPDVITEFTALARPDFDPADLNALPNAMEVWITALAAQGRGQGDPLQVEHFQNDLAAWRKEVDRIRLGIRLLMSSKAVCDANPADGMAAPWKTWLALQTSFARVYRPSQRIPNPGWRLFQLAFVLSHVPTLASRIPGFDGPDYFDPEFDEDAVTLLYMSTGGGKTEAFFGTVVFALFLDRFRGKLRGVTAMLHYPLRLLTVQQAQRLSRTLAAAEMVRRGLALPGAPFEIGFWVGGGNTPNAVADWKGVIYNQLKCIPIDGTARASDEDRLMNPDASDPADRLYQAAQIAWNKSPTCPFCKVEGTGLRLFPKQQHRLGIVCFNAECGWNRENGDAGITPLPFILTDADIYRRAPSILLGTIDKIALIGQNIARIGQIAGMFGVARYLVGGPEGMLEMNLPQGVQGAPLAPAFSDGEEVLFDPIPSLIIQDEMHLLDESLGTFGGLFETSLFEWFRSLGDLLGSHRTSRYLAAPDKVRLPHVIGATATASDVGRHVRAIYQRNVVQFPHPGPGLHEGFYVRLSGWLPEGEAEAVRAPLRGTPLGDEAAAPWARIYASLMTNGRRHTVTTMAVLATHAAASTRWLTDLRDSATRDRAAEEIAQHQSDSRFADRRAAAIRAAAAAGKWDALLALVDLHRIMLTYVTNKKGGDQILSAIEDEVRESHRLIKDQRYSLDHPTEGMRYGMALISGGVDVGTIQGVVDLAEKEMIFPPEKQRFDPAVQPPWRGLRGIVATSAVSHGVDVEAFNAMAFAGLPSDIAEYIQASSRVGRTHVGFSLLVPTPQTRRDRYVVEVHEAFHRLLERMIPPPATERWAEKAIERSMPSLIQNWLAGVYHQEDFASATKKSDAREPNHTNVATRILEQTVEFDACVDYIARAIGVSLPSSVGGSFNTTYYRRLIRQKLKQFLDSARESSSELREMWSAGMVSGLMPPMTSLRDVDGHGVVRPTSLHERREVNPSDMLRGLNAIRSGAPGRVPRGNELRQD